MAQSVESVRKEIGARVKNLREEHGWTDEVLGKMIGLSGSNLNNKERGIREFALDEIISLSDVFEITTDELLRGVKPENLAAHRKTGLSNDSVKALKDFFEHQPLKKVKGLNLALSSGYALDAIARYICFTPREKGYYLSESATYEHDRFIECRMSQQFYFNVLGQNLLQVLIDAKRKDYSTRKHYEAIEDFYIPFEEDDDETQMAEPSEYKQDEKHSDPI